MEKAAVESIQKATCRRYGLPWNPAPPHLKVGISQNVRTGLEPVNGLRHPPEGEATGWFIWAGPDLPSDRASDFFVPVPVEHLDDWRPEVLPFLGLPPGWRFLLAKDYADVWEDRSLLDVPK